MDYYLGQICVFAFDFEPLGFDRCRGQLVSVRDNEDLFRLIGYTFGSDNSREKMGLPDLRDKGFPAPSPWGQHPSDYFICMEGVSPWTCWGTQRPHFTVGQILLFPYPIHYDSWYRQDSLVDFLPCEGRYAAMDMFSNLHSLIGDRFGEPYVDGYGKRHFKLPDLRAKAPVEGLHYVICAMGFYPIAG